MKTIRYRAMLLALFGFTIPDVAGSQELLATKDGIDFMKYELVKGANPESEVLRKANQNPAFRAAMQDSRDADFAVVLAHRKAMAEYGYITIGNDSQTLHDARVAAEDQTTFEELERLLAYDPVARHLGFAIIGVSADPPLDDGLVHDSTAVLEHPSLGTICVRERSTATEPRTASRYMYGPKFDTQVNGSPALLTVNRSIDGEHGSTAVAILTERRLLELSAGVPLLKGDPRMDEFMELAGKL